MTIRDFMQLHSKLRDSSPFLSNISFLIKDNQGYRWESSVPVYFDRGEPDHIQLESLKDFTGEVVKQRAEKVKVPWSGNEYDGYHFWINLDVNNIPLSTITTLGEIYKQPARKLNAGSVLTCGDVLEAYKKTKLSVVFRQGIYFETDGYAYSNLFFDTPPMSYEDAINGLLCHLPIFSVNYKKNCVVLVLQTSSDKCFKDHQRELNNRQSRKELKKIKNWF